MKDQLDIEKFLTSFFTQHGCTIEKKEPGLLDVQLTKQLDQAIMNRPFYWHYMTATGKKGEPMKLTYCYQKEKISKETEWIHFGTPNMNQIFNYLDLTSRYIQVFEQLKVQEKTALYPWLLVNLKLSFKGRHIREDVLSIGLNLINGQLIKNAMETFEKRRLDESIQPNCYTISPMIKVESGFRRIENYIERYLLKQNYRWVIDSSESLKEELLWLNHFYKDQQKRKNLKNEIIQTYKRLKPEVSYQVINGGLVYCSVK